MTLTACSVHTTSYGVIYSENLPMNTLLALDAVFRSICACFPATMASRGWFRITLPYFMNIFLVALTAFGLTPSLLPLALYTATGNLVEQENLLQLAVQISAPGVMVGSFATFYVDIPLRYPVFLYLVSGIRCPVSGIQCLVSGF